MPPWNTDVSMIVYDLDGSAGELLRPLTHRHLIDYVSNFQARIGIEANLQGCRGCLEVLAYDHCLASARGISDWIAIVHAPDTFLASGVGPTQGGVLDVVKDQPATAAVLLLPMLHFDGPPESDLVEEDQFWYGNRSAVLRSFTFRRQRPDHIRAVVIARPESTDYIDGHRAWVFEDVPWPQCQVWVPPDQWRALHYVSLFVQRDWQRFGRRVRDISMVKFLS